MKISIRHRALSGLLMFAVWASAHADGPPNSNGVISNPTLVQNQNIAKAQAAGAISSFMGQGAKTCDKDGKNCHSVFGDDDTPDYTSLQTSSQSLTGVQAFSFMGSDGTEDGGDSNAVASQLGTLALACGDGEFKKVAGIAVKFSNCLVNSNGDAQVTVQVCSAPVRTNPITPPKNEVECSNDPTAPNYRPPSGYVCHRPACDTEPVGSLDGWSQPQTISFQANLPANATDDEKSKNGLGLIFYPPLSGGALASFTSDSDNMTAVKIVQTFINNETKRTAVGFKIAYRHKTQVTKEMIVQGASSVPNPSANTAQWDTITKLQANEKIPQFQQQYAANGSECLQQIGGGIAKDGKITVCDPNYSNESGIKPLQKTAQVATEGEDCGTTPQCLTKVINTNTWTESCSSEVPTAMRSCTTNTDYTIEHLSYTRTRSKELCHETRFQAEYACETSVNPNALLLVPRCNAGEWIDRGLDNGEFGAPGADKMVSKYYCDPAGATAGNALPIQVHAYGGKGSCIGWQTFDMDFSSRTHLEQAAALAPHWNGSCNYDVRVDADVTKPCNAQDTRCMANLTFYHYREQTLGQTFDQTCPAGQHVVYGGWDDSNGRDIYYCAAWTKSVTGVVTMDFLRPGFDVTYAPPVDTCTQFY